MASQLALRITSAFDKTGFESAKGQIRDFVTNLRSANSQTLTLESALKSLPTIIAGAFAASGIKTFIQSALEQERIVAVLSNRFVQLGESASLVGARIQGAVTDLASFSRFSQTELFAALQVLARNATSSAAAVRELAIAQNVAASSGAGLETSALAISRAQAGSATLLSRLVGLRKEEVAQARLHGNLLDVVEAKTRDAARAEGQTLSGEVARLGNRISELGQSIGKDLLPALAAITSAAKAVSDPIAKTAIEVTALAVAGRALIPIVGIFTSIALRATTLAGALSLIGGVAILGALAATTFALNTLKAQIDETKKAGDDMAIKFAGVSQAIRDDFKSFSSIQGALDGVNNAIKVTDDRLKALGDSTTAEAEKERGVFQAQLARFNTRKALLERAIQDESKLGDIEIDQEKKKFLELTQTKEDVRTTELTRELVQVQEIIAARKLIGDSTEAEERRLANVKTELHTLRLRQLTEQRQKQAELAQETSDIFKLSIRPLENVEGATDTELLARRKGILQEQKLSEQNILIQLQARLAAIDAEQTDESVKRKERTNAELKALSDIAQAKQDAAKELATLEEALNKRQIFVGTKSATLERQAEELQRRLRLETKFILTVDDDALEKIQKDTEITLRRFGFQIKEKVTNTVASGKAG